MDTNFQNMMTQMGIVSYNKQESMWKIAKRCAASAGVSMAGAGFVMGSKAGTVTLPGIGTISGAAAGALGGLFAGTIACTMLNLSVRDELKKIHDELPDKLINY